MRDYKADYEVLRAAVEAADKWERRYVAGEHGVGCPAGATYLDLLADDLRSAAQPEALARTCTACGAVEGEECNGALDHDGAAWRPPTAQPEALTEGPCERTTVEVCGFHGLDWPCAAQPEAREEQDEVRCGARVPTPHPRISQQCVLPPAHDGEHSTRPEAPTAEEQRRG